MGVVGACALVSASGGGEAAPSWAGRAFEGPRRPTTGATLDAAGYAKKLSAGERAELGPLAEQLDAGGVAAPDDVWPDEDGFVRKVSLSILGTELGREGSASVNFELWDDGEEVEIQLPPADEVVDASAASLVDNGRMGGTLEHRVEAFIREHDLIAAGGEVTCLVSGGADSTCLWHVLNALGYRVAAVHVNHGLRSEESEEDARLCAEALGAEVIRPSDTVSHGVTEAVLRDVRYGLTADRGLRATGHTASDQVETVLYRLVSSGSTRGIKARREDGIVRPLLRVWREDTEAYCREHGLAFRRDSSNRDTKRGLIRDEILPQLRELHPGADRNLLALADERPRLPRALERTLVELIATTEGTKTADLGNGVRAVREYDQLRLEGVVSFGPWQLESSRPGLVVRSRRPGDRLAGRRKKVQDLFVDAKVPLRDRDAWPLVVSGDEVVSVPGIAEAPGWEGVVRAWKDSGT